MASSKRNTDGFLRIARAILKKPSVFLFDEATSALDSRTEKDIQQALDEVSENQTTLMIAHRLSTIIHADEIIVLSEGEVVERGTHQHLMRQQGLYNAMWQRQSAGFTDTTNSATSATSPSATSTSAASATDPLQPDNAAS